MNNNKIPVLSLTHVAFSNAVRSALGKGHLHAVLAYEELFRSGKIIGRDPAFNNAQNILRDILEMIDLSMPTLVGEKNDGNTGKFLLKTHDQLEIESVLIPMQSGGTLCVSSQLGCRMGCTFCETGRMGLLRNLTTEEIVSQIFVARHELGLQFRNVVFMGMGEPFDNYDAVMQAIRVLQDPKGLGFGRKNITVSTSGSVPGILRLIQEGECAPNLAVSINAPQNEIRSRIMPITRKHSMPELHAAMNQYCTETGREILTAYVLMKGINDSIEQADQLADYLEGLRVKVNLIPYNSQSCERFAAPDEEVLNLFASRLRARGYYTLVRVTKGKSIMAACGQLGNLELRRTRNKIVNAPEPELVPDIFPGQ